MASSSPLKIGILNIMHDKVDTKKRFDYVLTRAQMPVELKYFYPKDHYQGRPVPPEVSAMAVPLELEEVAKLDAFIVTGAPIEKIAFSEVTYMAELHELFAFLEAKRICQLYVCFGAMAAANYFYGIEKHLLAQKLFGIYPQVIVNDSPLLAGLTPGFLAPHARYAELSLAQIKQTPELRLLATTEKDELFAMESRDGLQAYLFSHLEYEGDALLKEYQRELAAYPDQAQTLARPQNYFAQPASMQGPLFKWQEAQQAFFANWLQLVARHVRVSITNK